MARIEINNDIGGIELYFDTVPTEEDKEALKKNGFSWHAEKKCWYAKNTDNNREVASSIFDRIDKFNEETRNIIKVNDAGFDYAVIVMQAGKQCEVILREIIENEGIPVDERGFIDTSNDKRFPHHKNMPLLTYACMSPNLLPPEIRRVMDYIRKGRNMAAHIPAMTREQAEQFMQAFNAFSSWYYFHSGAYKSDQSKRLLAYMRLLNATPAYSEKTEIKEEAAAKLEQAAIVTAGTSMDKLEETIARIVSTEVQKGVADVTDVVKNEAGEIKGKLDELSELVAGLSEKIGDYQSLVEKQLSMATTTEEEEHIIHAFTEECVSKMEARFEKNTADKNYKVKLNILKETLGDVCWERLEPRSRTFLISSRIMYEELIVLDDIIDYSGVCLLVTKALEFELSKRFYTKFLKYLKDEYGKDYSQYPSTMLRKYNGNLTVMQKHDFTLGTIAYLFCMKPEGVSEQKEKDKGILLDFAEKRLYKSAAREEIEVQIDSFAKDIDEVKTKYRNKAAHTNELKKKNAKECFDIVLDVHKLLKTMIEAFDKTEE